MSMETLVARAQEIEAELDELAALAELTTEQDARFDELVAESTRLAADIDKIEKREAARGLVRDLRAKGQVLEEEGADRAPQFMKRTVTDIDLQVAGRGEVRSAAMKVLETEHRSGPIEVSDASAAHIEKMFGAYSRTDDGDVILDGNVVAKRMLITESPAYRSAFQKALKGQQFAWNDDEKQAMVRAAEQSLTSASGGYAVPVLIDPTVILTSGAAAAPVVGISRVEPITNNVWKGVSSAGVAFSNVPENTASTATQATIAQPTVTAHKINAFIPYSLEIEGDFPNFAGEMTGLLEQAYVDYLAEKTITGTGTIEMFGIFTAIDATAGSEVTVTTDGALGPEDVFKLWNGVPERHRNRSNWLSHVSVESQVRQSTNNGGLFTVDLTAEGIGVVNGRRWYTTDYAPSFSATTGAANLAILGNFQHYVIAQRVGMNIELIPHVVDGSGLPKGQRGWYAWARVGADSIYDDAFRLLQNT